MCTPLPIRGPRAARVLSHELGFLSASGIHEGIIVLSVRVRPMDARHEGEVIDQDSTVFSRCPTIQKYAFRGRGRGWRVCTTTSGGGRWWKCPRLCGSSRPAGLETCRPRVEYGAPTGCDLLRAICCVLLFSPSSYPCVYFASLLRSHLPCIYRATGTLGTTHGLSPTHPVALGLVSIHTVCPRLTPSL